MKTKSGNAKADDLRSYYDLRPLLRKGVMGKYAARVRQGTNIVRLDPDVAKAFGSDESVNEALHLVLRLRALSPSRRRAAATA